MFKNTLQFSLFFFHHLYHALVVIIFLALLLIPFSLFFENSINLSSMLSEPSFSHLLGTDNLGRDLLIRISDTIHSAVVPLWSGVAVGSFLGLLLSLLLIFLSQFSLLKFLDKFSIFLASIISSVPIGIACFVAAVLLEEADLYSILIPLAILFSLQTLFIVNSLFHRDQHLGYWTSHRALGGSLVQRVVKYGLLRSWKPELLQLFSFQLTAAIVIEASLSYLGFGIQEPSPSFGNILSSHFDLYLKGEWFILVIICISLFIVTAAPRSLIVSASLITSWWRNKSI